jgi:hypothetical protein
MTNRDVPESYGLCDECKNPIDRSEEVTYLFDKPVHTKCYPHEGEIQRRLITIFSTSVCPGCEQLLSYARRPCPLWSDCPR